MCAALHWRAAPCALGAWSGCVVRLRPWNAWMGRCGTGREGGHGPLGRWESRVGPRRTRCALEPGPGNSARSAVTARWG
eukprot:2604754-Prymnesium_polylepis.2